MATSEKKRKLEICPNPPNILTFSKLFSSKSGDFFGNLFSKKFSRPYSLGLFLNFFGKMTKSRQKQKIRCLEVERQVALHLKLSYFF